MGPRKSQKSKSSHYMPWVNKNSYFTIYSINMIVLVTLCCYDKISCIKNPNNLKKRGVILDYSYRRVDSIAGGEGMVAGAVRRDLNS